MQRFPKWRTRTDPLTLLIMLVGLALSVSLLVHTHLLTGVLTGG